MRWLSFPGRITGEAQKTGGKVATPVKLDKVAGPRVLPLLQAAVPVVSHRPGT
jgi:hypothetical protein